MFYIYIYIYVYRTILLLPNNTLCPKTALLRPAVEKGGTSRLAALKWKESALARQNRCRGRIFFPMFFFFPIFFYGVIPSNSLQKGRFLDFSPEKGDPFFFFKRKGLSSDQHFSSAKLLVFEGVPFVCKP